MLEPNLFRLINFIESKLGRHVSIAEISRNTDIHRNKMTHLNRNRSVCLTLTDIEKILGYSATLLKDCEVSVQSLLHIFIEVK